MVGRPGMLVEKDMLFGRPRTRSGSRTGKPAPSGWPVLLNPLALLDSGRAGSRVVSSDGSSIRGENHVVSRRQQRSSLLHPLPGCYIQLYIQLLSRRPVSRPRSRVGCIRRRGAGGAQRAAACFPPPPRSFAPSGVACLRPRRTCISAKCAMPKQRCLHTQGQGKAPTAGRTRAYDQEGLEHQGALQPELVGEAHAVRSGQQNGPDHIHATTGATPRAPSRAPIGSNLSSSVGLKAIVQRAPRLLSRFTMRNWSECWRGWRKSSGQLSSRHGIYMSLL